MCPYYKYTWISHLVLGLDGPQQTNYYTYNWAYPHHLKFLFVAQEHLFLSTYFWKGECNVELDQHEIEKLNMGPTFAIYRWEVGKFPFGAKLDKKYDSYMCKVNSYQYSKFPEGISSDETLENVVQNWTRNMIHTWVQSKFISIQ